ncbi:hypothetical protein BWI93_16515 [Siphonobacter sp. BAB-5385]|uniref:SGNH/GDSL hydrolase family protein n=1 Tax=Siphonobacter sp. BAB-5385 TaxID=1864822 RepID=UPI000B9E41FE|nr:SGNH/GDSL hydrolase family protein [Siphonobacter sp. BAB-5385]OZI07099.1 hypothetical protein BWI93_16515 [Siphonobacter sp. BAB-5385]
MAGFPIANNRVGVARDFFELYGHHASIARISTADLVLAQMTGAGQFLGSLTIPNKQMMFISTIVINSNKNVEINLVGLVSPNATNYGNYAFPNLRGWTGPFYGPLIFEINQFLDGSMLSTINWNITATSETTLTGHRSTITFNTIACYSDQNFYNDGLMLVIGDSIATGDTGPTTRLNHFIWESKMLFETAGRNLQIVNKAVGGSSSRYALYNINNGLWRYPDVKVIVENHGTNDVAQSTTNAQFTAYVQGLINWKKKFFKNTVLLFYGSTPLQVAANQAKANDFRTIKRDLVAAAGDPLIRYLNLGEAFVPADSKYAPSDGSGQGIHINDSGSADVITLLDNNQSLFA